VQFKAGILKNNWTHSWVFYHTLFWVFTGLNIAYDIIEYLPYDPVGFFASVFIRMILLAGLVYGNLYILIPFVFNRNKLLYWILLVLCVVLFVVAYKPSYFITTRYVGEVSDQLWVKIVNRGFAAIRMLLTSLFLKFIKDWFLQEKQISEITNTQLTTELHYLRSQVNPHFLFNTLNNIYSLTLKKSDKAPEVVLRLSEMMEYMLYESDDSRVPLEKEIKNLSNYLEIEKIRQGNNATIDFAVTGEFHGKKIAPLLFLPLLENAVKHGINKSIVGSFLNAKLSISSEQLTFTVENNNPVQEGTIKGERIGIQNLKKRLELFYKDHYSLHIDNSGGRFMVKLTIVFS